MEIDLEQLIQRVAVLIDEDGYKFSDEDMSLLREIKAELERMSAMKSTSGQLNWLDALSVVTKFLSFFDINDFNGLF
ncbi:hypothetical protein [Maribellus sediminis]|uniref:hypothetical protein n=1 Tax=Maribellus sediminis TaxID=2696285 RepID=UPI00142F5A57|nr:hypothetical protein [Maribellus sediminis]